MVDWRAVLGVLAFFIPIEVFSAVLLVFTLENVLDSVFALFVPARFTLAGYLALFCIASPILGWLNYVSADGDDLEDLEEDLDDL